MKKIYKGIASIFLVLLCTNTALMAQNMERHITLGVQSGEEIFFRFVATSENIPIKIVSGSTDTTIMSNVEWKDVHCMAGADTMVIYGDITKFYCSGNRKKIHAIHSRNTALTWLVCNDNQLTTLDVSNNTELTFLSCFNNPLGTNAINQLFCSLPDRTGLSQAKIYIVNNPSDLNYVNLLTSNKQIATAKNWAVKYAFNQVDISATNGTYVCGTTVAVNGVSLMPESFTMGIGTIRQLIPRFQPADATNTDVTWSSSDNSVAEIDTNGLVTAVAEGTATISVTTDDGGYTATAELTVNSGMNRYITLGVQSGDKFFLEFAADAYNTPVRIVSGNMDTTVIVDTYMNNYSAYTVDADTMTVFGDVTQLVCSGDEDSKLSAIDLSHNTILTGLDCSSNELDTLDISNNTALKWLLCIGGQLTTLDVSNNPALTMLLCINNQMTNLDVSNNPALTWLVCANNQLQTLDVSNNIALTDFLCFANPLDSNAVNQLFCSLPDRTGLSQAQIYVLNNTSDANHADVLASNKQIAIDKNWNVWYYDNFEGPLYNTEPATTGTYECESGIQDISKRMKPLVYPNPAQDILNIKAETEEYNVEIYNTLGQLVLQARNKEKISIAHLPNGFYTVRVISSRGVSGQELIKQ